MRSVKERTGSDADPEVSHLDDKESSYAVKRKKKIKSKRSRIRNLLTFLC